MTSAQLLQNIRSEIRRRVLLEGGWASGSARQASVEATCLAVLSLGDGQISDQGWNFLLQIQKTDGSWPAFHGDDSEGCWTTSLAVIALRTHQEKDKRVQKAVAWLLGNEGREANWLWNLKFRYADRTVRFDPDKHGWPWVPGTLSWVIPTAFALIALKQYYGCCQLESGAERIRLGTEMLIDRSCPGGGWNAGNGVVLGSALKPHIDPTATSLLALEGGTTDQVTRDALSWLEASVAHCSAPYSLAWASLALATRGPDEFASCIGRLRGVLLSRTGPLNIETLSVAAIALGVAEGENNPFRTAVQ
jgi:hypothetical protein